MECILIEKFFNTINSVYSNQKEFELYKKYENLTNSDIKFLLAVFNNPNTNSVELANILGVVRAAITKWGKKLEKEGLVEKFKKDENNKEKYYRLTKKGENIKNEYDNTHALNHSKICKYISSLTEEERNTITKFLGIVEETVVNRVECICDFSCK